MISAHELARATDVQSSHEAASRIATARAETELAAVAKALAIYPGSTSKELAEATPEIGFEIGQGPDEWRSTCGRRLPTGEDMGLFEATCPSPSRSRPFRKVDEAIKPCAVSGIRSIRWELTKGE